ncbi:MAG: hypothetical protein R3B07_21275 [Polyangiaceae bacterium]
MSDQDDDKKQRGAGRSGRAGDIGAELGDLDFEPDALLDSLLADDPASTPLPIPGRKPSSAPPAAREPQETLPDRGETADALKALSEDSSAISQRPGSPFLSKRHFATLPNRPLGPRSTSPQAPRSLARERDSQPDADGGKFRGSGEWSPIGGSGEAEPADSAPGPKLHEPAHRLFSADDETKTFTKPLTEGTRAPASIPPGVVARPRSKPPLPGARSTRQAPPRPGIPGAVIPRVSDEATRKPPAVNPAGPPPREPFPPAFSPDAPKATTSLDMPTPVPDGTEEAANYFSEDVASAMEFAKSHSELPKVEEVEDAEADALLEALDSGRPSQAELWTESEDWGESEVNAPFQAINGGTVDPEDEDGLAGEFESIPADDYDGNYADSGFDGDEVGTGEIWEDEQEAAHHLALNGMLDAWIAKAEWFEEEAEASVDAAARTRCLVVASELWAMAGDDERARKAAQAATKGQKHPLAQRQQRWLTQATEEWSQVAVALDQEAITSPTPESRAHSAYFCAEINRVVLEDADAASKKLDNAQRLAPSDPRAYVFKLARELAAGSAAPNVRLPDSPELGAIRAAQTSIATRRSAAPEPDSGAEAYLSAARRALTAGNGKAAGLALANLVRVPELRHAARWVAAALLAPAPDTRDKAIELLSAILAEHSRAETSPPAYLLHGLAARALEGSNSEGMQRALAASGDAFSQADQVAMALLSGADVPTAQLTGLAKQAGGAVLAGAALALQNDLEGLATVSIGEPTVQAPHRLGRSFSSTDALTTALAATAEETEQSPEHAALMRLLHIERAIASKDYAAAADTLGALAPPEADTSRQLVAALAHELTGGAAAALAAYQRAHGKSPALEAPLRAQVEASGARRAASLLEQGAEASENEARKALLLTEAAVRSQQDAPDQVMALLERARDADPGLPFAFRLAELSARMAGDPELLLEWIRQRRDTSEDPIETAHDQVREALLTADEDLSGAADLVALAAEERPGDVGLRELGERLNPGSNLDRGAWREAAAAVAEGPVKGRLLLEAALNYEREGDSEAAARAARAALEAGGGSLAEIARERTAAGTSESADLADLLLSQAKAETDPTKARALYERLSQLDLARGDQSSALLWQSAILEDSPDYLPALRQLEHAYLAAQRDEDLVPIERTLSTTLPGWSGLAHAILATRLIKKTDEWLNAKDVVYGTNHPSPRPYWLLRQLAAYAQATGDDAKAFEVLGELASQSDADLDASTLCLRAAETAARLTQREEARLLLDQAIDRMPEHLVALTTRADVLEASGDGPAAATALEAVAQASAVERHRLEAWYQAGLLWLDRAGNAERGGAALEQAANIDVTHGDVFERLRQLYVDQNERSKLAALLESRLARTSDPAERVGLEVTRAQALAEIGDRGAARAALAAALDANPEHVEALRAFAELCGGEGDWPEAEQAWIRLARHTQDQAKQAEIYRKLGEIYEQHIPTPDRAELSYREVLKRLPQDIQARERLVQVYSAAGNAERALAVQEELLGLAESAEDKRTRSLELAVIHEQVAGDKRKAEAILERTRKAAPTDPLVLRALAEFYARTGETRALNVLLDRTANDARRALGTGRFDPSFFEALGSVAEIRGDMDSALVATATLRAIQGGDPLAVRGGGAVAGQPRFDDLLAPDLLSLPLRSFIQKTGNALDGAYGMDLRAMRAQPLPQEMQGFKQQIAQLAMSYGIHNLEVLVAPHIGKAAQPASTNPPQLVIGKELLDAQDEAMLYFLVFRALKLIQANACALSRTAPIDLWPVVAALLSLFADNWQPQGADAKKFAVAQQRIRASLPRTLDDDVPVLALEVIGNIGNRASQLATSLHEWGNRTALLAIGDPRAALRAIAGGEIPDDDAERAKWVTRNAEARDLAVFSVSEKYAQARQALGL